MVGFPEGGATTAGKVAEATEIREMGCNELDMVINIAWLKAGEDERVKQDIQTKQPSPSAPLGIQSDD